MVKRTPQETIGGRHLVASVKGLRHWFEAKGRDTAPTLEAGRIEGEDDGPILGPQQGKVPQSRTKGKEPT